LPFPDAVVDQVIGGERADPFKDGAVDDADCGGDWVQGK
jgi:hypothetical protein